MGSKYARDPEAIARDVCIALRCDRFADVRPIKAMRELKAARGEYV